MFFRRKPLADLHDRGPSAGDVRHHEHARGRGGNAAGRTRPPLGSFAVPAGTLLSQGPGPLGRDLAWEIPAHHGLLTPQDRRERALAFGGADAAAADRRGRHRRRRRQDVLGTPGSPPGRRAGDRLGIALDRLARPRAVCQSPAGADHRRLHRRGRTAWPLPGGARRLHGVEDPRDPQRRRRGAVPPAAAQRDAAKGVRPGRRTGDSGASASWPRSARKRTIRCFCGPPCACGVRCPTPAS